MLGRELKKLWHGYNTAHAVPINTVKIGLLDKRDITKIIPVHLILFNPSKALINCTNLIDLISTLVIILIVIISIIINNIVTEAIKVVVNIITAELYMGMLLPYMLLPYMCTLFFQFFSFLRVLKCFPSGLF